MDSRQVDPPPPPPGFELDPATALLPPGFAEDAAPAAAAQPLPAHGTLESTPWHAQQIPLARVLAMGAQVPEAVENALPSFSATDASRALPAAFGTLGGMLASPGIATAAGGAALGGGFGEAARQLYVRAIGGRAPETSGEAALGIGKESAIQGVAQAAGGIAERGLKYVGGRLMHSALKPNISLMKEYKTSPKKLVETLLEEGVNVTPGGMEKLDRLFQATNSEIKEAVKGAQGLIPRDAVAAQAANTAQRLSRQVNPNAALRDVGRSVSEFLTEKDAAGNVVKRAALTVPEAQAMKVGTYQQIGKNYGKLSSASVETQKALARGLREEIEAAVPKIGALNAREARLMAAQDAVGHRVAIAGNRDPVGFAWVTHAPQTFLAALMDRSPVVKSMLARGMYASAAKAGKVSPALIRAAVLALASDESEPAPEPR